MASLPTRKAGKWRRNRLSYRPLRALNNGYHPLERVRFLALLAEKSRAEKKASDTAETTAPDETRKTAARARHPGKQTVGPDVVCEAHPSLGGIAMDDQIVKWECDKCGEDVAGLEGQLSVDMPEVNLAAQAHHNPAHHRSMGGSAVLMPQTDTSAKAPKIQWRVYHSLCDPDSASLSYSIDVADIADIATLSRALLSHFLEREHQMELPRNPVLALVPYGTPCHLSLTPTYTKRFNHRSFDLENHFLGDRNLDGKPAW